GGDDPPRVRVPRTGRSRRRAHGRRRLLSRRHVPSTSRALRGRRGGDGYRARRAPRPRVRARAERRAHRGVVRRGRRQRSRPSRPRPPRDAFSRATDRGVARGARRGAVNSAGTRGLAATGTVIAVAMLALSLIDPHERPAAFVACALVAGAGYLLALGL